MNSLYNNFLDSFINISDIIINLDIKNISIIFEKGGFIMYPLVLLSFISMYIIIYKILDLSFRFRFTKQWYENLYNNIKISDEKKIRDICNQRSHNLISKTIILIINKVKEGKIKNKSTIIYNETKLISENLEKKINILGIISGAAPMLGFLGTVSGMINSFIKISHIKTQISPATLSVGIYEAMITTAVGLTIGIVSFIFYNFFVIKVNNLISKLEYYMSDLSEIIEQYDITNSIKLKIIEKDTTTIKQNNSEELVEA